MTSDGRKNLYVKVDDLDKFFYHNANLIEIFNQKRMWSKLLWEVFRWCVFYRNVVEKDVFDMIYPFFTTFWWSKKLLFSLVAQIEKANRHSPHRESNLRPCNYQTKCWLPQLGLPQIGFNTKNYNSITIKYT